MQTLSQTKQWVTLLVPATIAEAEQAMTALLTSAVIRETGVQPDVRDNFLSAVREMLLNAIEHGGNLDRAKQIRVDLLLSKRALTCWIKDPGPGFRLAKLTHAAVNNPEDDAVRHTLVRESAGMRPGGYGILLAKNFADELIYNEQGNEVVLVKYLD
ncbi:MAG: ATP-binding protein [Bryobacter sp.]|jgi:anti-sigma regulatory factor (Ser/Thr protein kinase)|nr:ATP-binding protein [Bryobacter sp. CoA8 C33]